MTKDEALKLALEAFGEIDWSNNSQWQSDRAKVAIATLKKAMAQPEQEPVACKLVPIEPTDEMLKAMDECSTEGYDERLYAGHAASVYMAAVDVAPTPPQREWVGLTDDEIKALVSWWPSYDQIPALMVLVKDIQNSFKDKNAGR